jgi:hypothetical protein
MVSFVFEFVVVGKKFREIAFVGAGRRSLAPAVDRWPAPRKAIGLCW